jgi:GDP-L-fucose synthase
MSRFHAAKLAGELHVSVWGTGAPRREFLAVDDLADACVFVMKHYSDVGFLNIGSGEEITIADFARLVTEVVGYQGKIVFDPSHPDGMPRKLLDSSKLTALGWRAQIPLRDGLHRMYADFLSNAPKAMKSNSIRGRPETVWQT